MFVYYENPVYYIVIGKDFKYNPRTTCYSIPSNKVYVRDYRYTRKLIT
jgi:hypothetical protein